MKLTHLPAIGLVALLVSNCGTMSPGSGNPVSNNLTYALAWKQTAAEYRALYHQGFNLARERVQAALAVREAGDKPLAVITDVDDTVLLAHPYWSRLLAAGGDFFDDSLWDGWVPENEFLASPGAREFLSFCQANGVEVFYVTNRDQGAQTTELALANLSALGFPFVDRAHLRVLRETSNKEAVQRDIMQTHEVVALLGDNLNDFARKYYVADVDSRIALMEEDRSLYGNRYILFPNPTDGHWIRAIFGQSEPEPSAANRARLRQTVISPN